MLSTKLTKSILSTNDNYIKALQKVGIVTVWDFLNHFPRNYEDRTNVLDAFSLINLKEKNTMLVKLVSIDSKKTANNKLLIKAILEDRNGFLAEGVWFNKKYFASQMHIYVWEKILISWKIKYDFWKITFQNWEIETDLSKVSGEIVPIYSDLNYIPSTWILKKMSLLRKYISDIKENLPKNILNNYKFISRKEAYNKIHFPISKNDYELARNRLAYEELFEINYKAINKKYEWFKKSQWKSIDIGLDAKLVKKIISGLPFSLTDKQRIVLFQILKDMENTHAMNRLLEWDVWTGKTIVAIIAAIHAVLKTRDSSLKPLSQVKLTDAGKRHTEWTGIQVAFMSPTEILSRQHFESFKNMLLSYDISSNLLVWSASKKQKNFIKTDLKNGNLDMIFGTHSLLQEDIFFNNLWFIIIDEQHRFWVMQRELLESWSVNKSKLIPHNLNMTATPIPRTLALTLYWDQDLSIINEYPSWRKEIFTKVIKNDEERRHIELFVRSEIEKWRQVFWISPLIQESEKIDLANTIAIYESLTDIFSPYSVWLLHGKMKNSEKESIMRDFSESKIQILSSTSIVEVWIDVLNATIMCIEWAERFGLSQLHQFRWRVGRWKHQSYCYLFPSSWNYTDRLRAMERTNNGFELSEIDLEIRGPWEVYGVKQSWLPDLKVASLTDLDLISQIRKDIEEMIVNKWQID